MISEVNDSNVTVGRKEEWGIFRYKIPALH